MKALEGFDAADRPTTRRADSAAAPARRPRPKVLKAKTRETWDSGTRRSRGVHEAGDDAMEVSVGVGSRGGVVGGGVGVGIGGAGGSEIGGDGDGGGGVAGGDCGGVGVGGVVGVGGEGGEGGGGGLMRWRRTSRSRVVRRLSTEVGEERAMVVRLWTRRVISVREDMVGARSGGGERCWFCAGALVGMGWRCAGASDEINS